MSVITVDMFFLANIRNMRDKSLSAQSNVAEHKMLVSDEEEELDDCIVEKFKIMDSDDSEDDGKPWTDTEEEKQDWI